MKVIAVIPARYDSERLPGKLMKDLCGAPVVVRTFQAVYDSRLFDQILVVTDSDIILDDLSSRNIPVIKSKKTHQSGSDRIAEAIENYDVDVVINIQADEPFIDKKALRKMLKAFEKDHQKQVIDVVSLMVRVKDSQRFKNPNEVKVVVDSNDFALYFSRAPIPFERTKISKSVFLKHIGVYGFRKSALIEFYNAEQSSLEQLEKLEQLRYLEMGKKIKMILTDFHTIGIDTIEDLEEARREFNFNQCR